MACTHAVLSQNPEDIATATREQLVAPGKLSLLGNGVDLQRFDRARVRPLRRELGIAEDALVVGFCGRLVEEKGVLELFGAMQAVRARFPAARLLLVGPIDRAKADAIDQRTAARFGLAEACVFTGHRDDIPDLLAAMDVFALPSHREGFPRTPMEASALGVPVVATNIRGCRSAVVDGETGLLVPLKDPAALAEALIALLGDPVRRRALGEAGRRHAELAFDQRRVFATVLATYRRLLATMPA
jgi:glycosyltransferase involved in cell wall biosynthesis